MNGKDGNIPRKFDPVTKGHLDVLAKAYKMFGKVIIAVLKNDSKKMHFYPQQTE